MLTAKKKKINGLIFLCWVAGLQLKIVIDIFMAINCKMKNEKFSEFGNGLLQKKGLQLQLFFSY